MPIKPFTSYIMPLIPSTLSYVIAMTILCEKVIMMTCIQGEGGTRYEIIAGLS